MSTTPATEEPFREDAELMECAATVTVAGEGAVQPDRTVFYPQAGGQAGDTGVLVLADGRTLAIADTRKGSEPGQSWVVLGFA
jgi:misacylated tRNA(Ala) deacylase